MTISRKDPVRRLKRLAGPVAAGVALSCAGGLAAAAEPGFYAVVDLALTNHDLPFSQSDLDDITDLALAGAGLTLVSGDSNLDKSGLGYSLGFGYQFNSYLALEASYLDAGKSRYKASGTATDGVTQSNFELGLSVKSRGPAASLVVSWPVSEAFSLDARAGAFFSKTRLGISATVGGGSDSDSDSQSDTGVLLGAGATWSITPRTGLRFAYTLAKDAVGGEEDISLISVGIRTSFGN